MTHHVERSPWIDYIKCASAPCRNPVRERGEICMTCVLQQKREIEYLRVKKAQKEKHA